MELIYQMEVVEFQLVLFCYCLFDGVFVVLFFLCAESSCLQVVNLIKTMLQKHIFTIHETVYILIVLLSLPRSIPRFKSPHVAL